MDEDTNQISKILYTILIILICVILGVYLGKMLIWLSKKNYFKFFSYYFSFLIYFIRKKRNIYD